MSLSKNNFAFSSSSLSEDSENSLADVTYFPGSANDSRDTVYSNDEDNPMMKIFDHGKQPNLCQAHQLQTYAVRYLGIKSITHKYLIKGHTQNEGDSAHSLIERATKRILKSGPVYTTDSFITIIRSAKKTAHPFLVQEMSYGDFFDIKLLSNDRGPLNMGEIKISGVKILKVQRKSPNSVLFKTSYAEEKFREATIIKSKKEHSTSIDLQKAYHSKIGIPNNKTEDINELIKKNLIPRFYQ